MKIRAVAAASALLLSATIPSAASAGSRSGDYVAVRAIGGISTVDGITENQSGPVTGSNTDDLVAGLGVALGYDWSAKGFPVRTEIAYHYRFRFDFDLRIDDGVSGDGFENNLSTQAVLVSLFYDFDLGPRWKPFVGLGVGWARNTSDVRRTPLIAGTSEDREDTSDNFAWTAGFGITYRGAIRGGSSSPIVTSTSGRSRWGRSVTAPSSRPRTTSRTTSSSGLGSGSERSVSLDADCGRIVRLLRAGWMGRQHCPTTSTSTKSRASAIAWASATSRRC